MNSAWKNRMLDGLYHRNEETCTFDVKKVRRERKKNVNVKIYSVKIHAQFSQNLVKCF